MREWADSVTIYFLVFGWTSLFSISRVPPLSLLWSVLQPCKPRERLYTWFTSRQSRSDFVSLAYRAFV